MSKILNSLWVLAVVISFFFVVKPFVDIGEEPTPIPRELLEGLLRPEHFPSSLFCDEADRVGVGPTWNEITVGEATLEDLIAALEPHEVYDTYFSDNIFSFIIPINNKMVFHLPQGIACINNEGIVVALRVSPTDHLYLGDFVHQYGEPDIVTWRYGDPRQRLLIWFTEGVAVTAFGDVTLDDINRYGSITSVTYFPRQEGTEFENKYPYNRIWFPQPSEFEDIQGQFGPENPFDFDAMIATLPPPPTPYTITPPADFHVGDAIFVR